MRFILKSATLQDFTLFVSSFSAVGNKPPFQTFQKAEKKRTRWGLKQWQRGKKFLWAPEIGTNKRIVLTMRQLHHITLIGKLYLIMVWNDSCTSSWLGKLLLQLSQKSYQGNPILFCPPNAIEQINFLGRGVSNGIKRDHWKLWL